MKPFLVLQARPETEAADGEFAAFLRKSGLDAADFERLRLERDELPADINLARYSGVILGGGPGCVSDPPDKKSADEKRTEEALFGLMPRITAEDFPFLGCCFGIGILGQHLGGEISKARWSEPVGVAHCRLTGAPDPLLDGVPAEFDAFVGHKEAAQAVPPGAAHLVEADSCPVQMFRHGANVYATQFHPEADAAEFELRIRLYKDRGYFAPGDAERLIGLCQAAEVFAPERILRNFVNRYRTE
jgi:GMP synthase (glutamine-hydrolysing)